jgi:hypothetical protein
MPQLIENKFSNSGSSSELIKFEKVSTLANRIVSIPATSNTDNVLTVDSDLLTFNFESGKVFADGDFVGVRVTTSFPTGLSSVATTPITNTAITTTPATAFVAGNIVALDTLRVASTATKGATIIYEITLWEASNVKVGTANYVVTADTTEKFVSPVAGEYNILLPGTVSANNGLFAQVAVSDIPVGVYNYKIVKSYPDGRVITIEDTAEVTSLDANQLAVFGTSTKANNVKFNDNWKINEPNTEFKKGKFTYAFTFNGVTRNYVVNLVDQPSLEVSSVKIGATAAQLFDGFYTLKPITYTAAQDILLAFTQKNIGEATHISIARASGITADANNFVLSTSVDTMGEVALKDLVSLTIGTLNGARAGGDKLILEVTFWKNVNFSVNSGRFIQVGEKQSIKIGYLTPLS